MERTYTYWGTIGEECLSSLHLHISFAKKANLLFEFPRANKLSS